MGTLNIDGGLQEGRSWPLGAHWDGAGVNFALFSAHAERVRLCVFEGALSTRCPCQFALIKFGTAIYRMPGPADLWLSRSPVLGTATRFRSAAPAGRSLRPRADRHLHLRAQPGGPKQRLKAVVVDEPFDWDDDAPPALPLADSVLYEIHVKGATRQHPEVSGNIARHLCRAGIATDDHHFKHLGVSAIKLLPIHCFLDEERLIVGDAATTGAITHWPLRARTALRRASAASR